MNFFLNRIPPVNRAATEMAVADVAMAIFQVVLRPLSLPLELEPDEPLSKFVIRYILNITLYKIWLKKYVIIDFGMNWSLDLNKQFFLYLS